MGWEKLSSWVSDYPYLWKGKPVLTITYVAFSVKIGCGSRKFATAYCEEILQHVRYKLCGSKNLAKLAPIPPSPWNILHPFLELSRDSGFPRGSWKSPWERRRSGSSRLSSWSAPKRSFWALQNSIKRPQILQFCCWLINLLIFIFCSIRSKITIHISHQHWFTVDLSNCWTFVC